MFCPHIGWRGHLPVLVIDLELDHTWLWHRYWDHYCPWLWHWGRTCHWQLILAPSEINIDKSLTYWNKIIWGWSPDVESLNFNQQIILIKRSLSSIVSCLSVSLFVFLSLCLSVLTCHSLCLVHLSSSYFIGSRLGATWGLFGSFRAKSGTWWSWIGWSS